MRKIRSITLCSSVAFYKEGLIIKDQLEKLGFKVFIEHTAKIMQRTGDFRVASYKHWYKDASLFKQKARLMKTHFDKIAKSDAILVINLTKRGVKGYIGGNVLMEMGIAFYLGKKIFILNPVSKTGPLYEEILGVLPTFISGNLRKIG